MTLDQAPLPGDEGSDVSVELDRLERQFGRLFDAYRQRLRQRAVEIDPELQPVGYRTVFILVIEGPLGAGPLAEALGVDKSVLSRQLHQLAELGLIEREQDPADRRAAIISATPAAVARVDAIRAGDRDEFRSRLAEWDRGDLHELVRLLGKLAEL